MFPVHPPRYGVYVIKPQTDKAREWIKKHSLAINPKGNGNTLAVDPREISAVVGIMQSAGMAMEIDFTIFWPPSWPSTASVSSPGSR